MSARHSTLRTGARTLDDGAAHDIGRRHASGRVVQIKARNQPSTDLTCQLSSRLPISKRQRFLHSSNQPQPLGAAAQRIGGDCKRPSDVDDDNVAAGLISFFDSKPLEMKRFYWTRPEPGPVLHASTVGSHGR